MKLPSKMTIEAMAKKAGVPRETMRRRLHALDRAQGGVFVTDPAGRRFVDVQRVLSLCDDFFGKYVATPGEVDELRTQVHALRDAFRRLAARVSKLEAAPVFAQFHPAEARSL